MSDGVTVLDQFKILLGFDLDRFKRDQDEINARSKDTKDRARRTAEDVEEAARANQQFFDKMIDSSVRLGAVLLGGAGLKELIQNSITGGAAMGYMATNIGISAHELGKWQTAAEQMNEDAGQVAPALLGISNALTEIETTGAGSGRLIAAFNALGVMDFTKANGELKTTTELLMEMHKTMASLPAPVAYSFGTMVGLTPGMISLLRQADPEFQKIMRTSERVNAITERQVQDFQKATAEWGLYKGALRGVGYELAGDVVGGMDAAGRGVDWLTKALQRMGVVGRAEIADFKKAFATIAGAFAGALTGAAVGSVIPVVGTAVGAVVGAIGGGAAGEAAGRTWAAESDGGAEPRADGGGGAQGSWGPGSTRAQADRSSWALGDWDRELSRGPGPERLDGPTGGSGSWGPSAPPAPQRPGLPDGSDFIFRLIQKLEGAVAASVTPTDKANDPYAYGKNQITLGTALQHDRSATREKLLDPAYNDALARRSDAEYIARYRGDVEAIAVAYNAGPGVADRFVATRDLADVPKQTREYIGRERKALAAGATTNNSSSTSTANIGHVSVNAPNATDARGIAAEMRQALEEYQLMSQAAPGGQ